MTPAPPQSQLVPRPTPQQTGVVPPTPATVLPPDLRQLLKSSITNFCAVTIRPMIDTDKVTWNARVRRNELYYRGLQYLSYTPGGQSGIVDYQPLGANQDLQLSTGNQESSLYDYVLNALQGDVDTFIAVLGSRSPNTQCQARDLSNEAQIRLKMKADRVSSYLDSYWDVAALHSQLVRGLALYGTMFSHVRYTTNPRKWGVTPVQTYTVQDIPMGSAYYQCFVCGTETPADMAQGLAAQQPPGSLPPNTVPCSKCGTPLGEEFMVQPDSMSSLVPSQVLPFANGACEIDVLNPAHVTAPVFLMDVDKLPWIVKESEDDKGALVEAYPELRSKVYSDQYYVDPTSSSASGRWTRDLLTSPSGYITPRSRGRWLHTQVWIAPTCFEYLPNDRSGRLRDWLLKTYPDGFRAPMVNGELLVGNDKNPQDPDYAPCRIVDERLTSVWAACKPKPSEMLYADPYFECMIQGQDCINDSVSMLIEQVERSNPFVIADPEVLDPDMLMQYNSIPGEFKFAKPGSVGRLDQAFFRVPAAEVNPVLTNFIDKYIAWCREITGITPAVFGGEGAGGEKTARQYEIMRNQALMKLNTPWGNCRKFWAQTKENGIYQIAKFSGGRLHSRDRQGTLQMTEIEGVWELLGGGWYMECEESMPETIGQRRDFVMNTLTMPPEAQDKLGMNEPDNIILIKEAVGLSDWKTPYYNQVIRLHDIIGQLKAQQSQPGQPGPPDPQTGQPGQPGPPQPSIPFDSFLFDPQMAIKVLRDWLLGDEGEAARINNPAGYDNVTAYAHAVQSSIQPPPPPPLEPKTTITVDFSELVPDVQMAVMQHAGLSINLPPGAPLAVPKQPPMPMGRGGGHPPLPSSQPGQMPENGLAVPPIGGAAPSDLAARPPISPLTNGVAGLATQPPGGIQGPIGVQ